MLPASIASINLTHFPSLPPIRQPPKKPNRQERSQQPLYQTQRKIRSPTPIRNPHSTHSSATLILKDLPGQLPALCKIPPRAPLRIPCPSHPLPSQFPRAYTCPGGNRRLPRHLQHCLPSPFLHPARDESIIT